ncbi:MAG: class I SAM-dependent methyltransferase [Thalassobaculales bacterium]
MPDQSSRQHWDPERYARNAGFVPVLGQPVVELLAPQAGERVLDLGCGDGVLTERLVAAGATVTAVDASPQQIAAARARGLDARVMDGQHLAFEGEFDAVFSNAALHWMPDHAAVLAGVHRALKPGGRFACECGGFGNVATVRAALHLVLQGEGLDPLAADPWRFPGPQEMTGLLEAAGFRVEQMSLFARPTMQPGRLAGWLDAFGEPFLLRLEAGRRKAAVERIEAALRPCLVDHLGRWWVDYVRLRFLAVRP